MNVLKTYPAYKDSGVDWLGEIPQHWEVKRLKFVAPIIKAKLDDKPDEMPYIALEHIESNTGRLINNEEPQTVESSVSMFRKGDILFGKLRPYLNKVVHVQSNGTCSSELVIFRTSTNASSRYLFYVMLSKGFVDTVNAAAYGVKMPRATPEQIGNMRMSVLSFPEQEAIANFLDERCGRIDELIKKKEQLIVLLKEKRTAIISHAVTKGLDHLRFPLDPTPIIVNKIIAAGDREVPWLWKCLVTSDFKPIKYLCNINAASLPETTGWDAEILYIDISSIDSEGNIANPDIMIFENAPSRARRIIKNNDVLISTVRTYLRAIAYIEKASSNLICSTGFAVITAGPKIDPKFLFYWIRSALFVDEIMARSVGVNYPAINASEIGNLPFPMIGLDEQRRIAKFLDSEIQKIDALTESTNRAVEKLKEYRSAIITAAVTGKIDVREN